MPTLSLTHSGSGWFHCQIVNGHSVNLHFCRFSLTHKTLRSSVTYCVTIVTRGTLKMLKESNDNLDDDEYLISSYVSYLHFC